MYLESLLTLLSLQYWTNCFSILEDCIRVDERNPEFVIEETDFVEKKKTKSVIFLRDDQCTSWKASI